MNDFISVLIPIYNGEKYLQESLDSLYAQTFQKFEIVIVDDGSTDSTASIIKKQSDNRIRYFRNDQNSGIVFTLNKGLSLCKGRYIARMDADDLSLPKRLEEQWNFMEANPDVVLLGTSINKFSENYSIVDYRGGRDAQIRAKLVFDTAINHPSAMIRKKVIDRYQLQYPSDYPHAEDYAFWYQLSKYGKIANLDPILLRYRMHGDNVSMKFNHQQYDTMNRIRKHILADFWADEGEKGVRWMKDFSNLIQLKKIGMSEMRRMDMLLRELLSANLNKKTYDKDALAKNAAWFWYVVYVHENCFKFSPAMIFTFLLRKSSIAYFLEKSYRKKLWVKSLLFWHKK